ncbi:MAG: Crp/Fnr family transcriptional regulator [Fusobacteriaceae bacterium]|jgi:CRP-like cAMP-binding protein|nr:Crp/Fnr family transcriptional regulator [Fusobacteriaceae bacterium]
MQNFTIDNGIPREEIREMISCFQPELRTYSANETILCYSDKKNKIGVLLTGSAHLYAINSEGEYQELETYRVRDVFGEIFHVPIENFEYIIESTSYAKVMFIDYKHIITPCSKICEHHTQLINNLFHMTAKKVQLLSLHLSIISQNTIRKKLLAYLKYIRHTAGSNPFTIPLSLISLSEYLCVDRSAMMREISHLKRDGVLSSQGTRFYLSEA